MERCRVAPRRRCNDLTGAGPDADIGRQTALHATVETPLGPVELVTVHLTPRSETAQLNGITYLLAYLGNLPEKAVIVLTGDFNATPESRSIQIITGEAEAKRSGVELRDAWELAHPGDPGPTMPSHEPVARIDYILVGTGISVVDTVRLGTDPDEDGFYPSDHLGLAATLVRNPSSVWTRPRDRPPWEGTVSRLRGDIAHSQMVRIHRYTGASAHALDGAHVDSK